MKKISTYLVLDWWVLVWIEWLWWQMIQKEKIADVFERYGWSFTQALWIALYRADPINTIKILENWENDIKEFIEKFILSQE